VAEREITNDGNVTSSSDDRFELLGNVTER